jgi:NADH:ubiquinone oxidoreductase subunit 6 (subunit J)
METAFLVLALGTLVAAVAAMSLRNLIHCALCLVGVFAGVAGLFLLLGAEFVAFAQVLVYVGAISILIVFALLLTRTRGAETADLCVRPRWLGTGVAGLAAGLIIGGILVSPSLPEKAPAAAMMMPVRELGRELLTRQAPALLVVGLLLTAALIGAVVLAVREPPPPRKEPPA